MPETNTGIPESSGETVGKPQAHSYRTDSGVHEVEGLDDSL